jgi:hypothetical protein
LVFAVDQESAPLLTGEHPVSAVVAESTVLRPGATDIASSLAAAMSRGIDREVWARTTDELFFHADGTCVQHIAGFVRSL